MEALGFRTFCNQSRSYSGEDKPRICSAWPGQSHALTRLMLRLTPSEESQIGQSPETEREPLGAGNSSRKGASMTPRASHAGIALLALLGSNVVALRRG